MESASQNQDSVAHSATQGSSQQAGPNQAGPNQAGPNQPAGEPGSGEQTGPRQADPGGSKPFNLKEFLSPGADSPFAAMHTARLGEEFMLLLREYLRQQAVRPFRALLRWVVFGLLGAVLILGGLTLLALAGLRALQVETGSAFTGNLSWLPYLITAGGLLLLMLVTFLAMSKQTTGKPPDSDPPRSNSKNPDPANPQPSSKAKTNEN